MMIIPNLSSPFWHSQINRKFHQATSAGNAAKYFYKPNSICHTVSEAEASQLPVKKSWVQVQLARRRNSEVETTF